MIEKVNASPCVKWKAAIALLLFLFSGTIGFAQCVPAPPADVTCMSGTTVTNGANINSGTFVHCGASGSFSNVNVSGGTLQVCGQLTISNLTFNSGTIHISQYGQLTITGNVTLNNNCTIVNYGRLNVNGNLQWQNSNNYVYNARVDASIIVGGTISFPSNVGQNAYLVNKGYMTANTFTLSDGCVVVCMEDASYLGVNNFNLSLNNINNPITYGSIGGSARIRYATSANLGGNAAKAVTLSSSINVCRATGASLSGSGSWGLATLTSGCAATSIPTQTGVVVTCFTLPVEWLSFDGAASGKKITLDWKTASEKDNDYFEVEVSRDAGEFEPIGRVRGSGSSTQINAYSFSWNAAEAGDYYFRLKQVDFNGQFDYCRMISVHVASAADISAPFPNPFTDALTFDLPDDVSFDESVLTIYNNVGQVQQVMRLAAGKNNVDLNTLTAGAYTAVLISSNGELLFRGILMKSDTR